MALGLGFVAWVQQEVGPGNAIAPISPETVISQIGNDPAALDRQFSSRAQAECGAGADGYLRSVAANDFAWDDDAKSWLGVKFDKFSKLSVGLGMLTLVSTKAKLSNGFGAFQHVELYCLYNTASQEVVRYLLSDPALDDVVETEQPRRRADPVIINVPQPVGNRSKAQDALVPDQRGDGLGQPGEDEATADNASAPPSLPLDE